MKGWAQDVVLGHNVVVHNDEPNAIGLVIAPHFPDEEVLRETLERGAKAEPAAVWVFRGEPRKNESSELARLILEDLGIEPYFARTNSAFWGNSARTWRDAELIATCKMVVVFHDLASPTTQEWADRSSSKIHVIERGKKKKQTRKGRKPVGS